MQSIIISGMPACGKTTVGSIVASRFGMKLVGGGDILKEIAQKKGYMAEGKNWWDTSSGMKFLKERKKNLELDREVDKRLVELAKEGNYVITSYTLPWISDYGLKVWLIASTSSRAKRMARRDGLSIKESTRILKVRDIQNYFLYKKLYGFEFGEDLSPFHLVVDTENLDENSTALIIVKFAEAWSSKVG